MIEVLGATLYLLNKIFFLLREVAGIRGRIGAVRFWKIAAWLVGIVGLIPVSYVLLVEADWIFGCFELGAAPSMLLGLTLAFYGAERAVPKWVDWLVYVATGVGVVISYRVLGGLLSFNQGLEMAAIITFIPGSYQLAKDDRRGYLWYIAMFAAAGTLLYRQSHYWFVGQQVASALIIISAYFLASKRTR